MPGLTRWFDILLYACWLLQADATAPENIGTIVVSSHGAFSTDVLANNPFFTQTM